MSKKRSTTTSKKVEPKNHIIDMLKQLKPNLEKIITAIKTKEVATGITLEQKVVLTGVLELFSENTDSHSNAIMIGVMTALLSIENKYWVENGTD